MAIECYKGTSPLLPHSSTLPLPTARCIPDDGICFSSLSRGDGLEIAQFGCWPSQTTMKLAWLGVPECKNEVGRLICLCIQSLCNSIHPSPSDIHPEWGEQQGLSLVFLVLLLPVITVILICSLRKYFKWCFMKNSKKSSDCSVRDIENGAIERDILSVSYQVASSPYFDFPQTPPYCGSPAPLVRRSSAP